MLMNYKLIPIYIYLTLLFILILIRISYTIFKKKYKNYISANDIIFKENKWKNNYMFGLINFKETKNYSFLKFISNFLIRHNKWEETESSWYLKNKIRGIVQIDNCNDIYTFLDSLENTKPPILKKKYLLPYRIVFLTKNNNIILLLNHFYCDGIILHDMLTKNLLNTAKSINFFPYKYYPIYSDICLLNFFIRHFYNYFLVKDKSKYLKLSNKSFIINKNIYLSEKLDRWIVMSNVIDIIFNNITSKKKYLTVAITVGFDDNNDFCNNRIGAIILRIPRMKSIGEYTKFLKKKLYAKQNQSLITYDLLRNFPSQYLRTKFNGKIDVLLTTLKLDGFDYNNPSCELKNVNYIGGTFIGSGKIPIYALSMSLIYENLIKLTLKINTQEFDVDNLLKDKNTEILFISK